MAPPHGKHPLGGSHIPIRSYSSHDGSVDPLMGVRPMAPLIEDLPLRREYRLAVAEVDDPLATVSTDDISATKVLW